MKTIAIPGLPRVAMASSSSREPPGWTAAVVPASTARVNRALIFV